MRGWERAISPIAVMVVMAEIGDRKTFSSRRKRRTGCKLGAMSVARTVRMLAFVLAWLMPWRIARTSAVPSRLIFYVYRRDAIGRHIAKYGTHEPLLTRWLANYLKDAPRGLFVDVGANIGWHTLHAAQQRTIELVVAFEPDPLNASLLERNIRVNALTNVIVSACAVGARPGTIRLFRYKGSNFGRHSVLTDYGYGSHSVSAIDLDSALTQLQLERRPIAVLKIDVEGFEPAVIEGASEMLERTNIVILEYSPELSRAGKLNINGMFERLQNFGFTPFALLASGGVARIDIGELNELEGSIDLVWGKPNAVTSLDEQVRERVSLRDTAEQNKHVKTP